MQETLECLRGSAAGGNEDRDAGDGGDCGVVAEFLERLRGVMAAVPVVLDPVVRSSSGRELLDAEGVVAMRERLLPVVDWVTPNMEELGSADGARG